MLAKRFMDSTERFRCEVMFENRQTFCSWICHVQSRTSFAQLAFSSGPATKVTLTRESWGYYHHIGMDRPLISFLHCSTWLLLRCVLNGTPCRHTCVRQPGPDRHACHLVLLSILGRRMTHWLATRLTVKLIRQGPPRRPQHGCQPLRTLFVTSLLHAKTFYSQFRHVKGQPYDGHHIYLTAQLLISTVVSTDCETRSLTWGKNVEWWSLRTRYWGEYLDRRKRCLLEFHEFLNV
jgi:hypothetical protein